MKNTIIIVGLIYWVISIQSCVQSEKDPNSAQQEAANSAKGSNDFPELIQPDIPGAPKLGKPQLIMGETAPVWGGGMGWAAPAVYDWNKDGKKDLLIGEFGSGMEYNGINVGNFVRVYENEGTDTVPAFSDIYNYARGVQDEVEHSTGTPLSVYTWCCLAFTPRLVDLDNDGFVDLLTGQYNPGYITWFRGSEEGFLPGVKLKEAYDPLVGFKQRDSAIPFTDPTSRYYWSYSSAAFGDFDGDGDEDMIIGGSAVRICENIGTKSAPRFGRREPLKDLQGNNLESGSNTYKGCTVPYVVDWDQDGVLDIFLTNDYNNAGCDAVKYFRGVKGKEGLRFEPGIPLFSAKDGGKAFAGSWLNVCVTDWNNDGINDLLIGASVATLDGNFDHELSWTWETETDIIKKNPANYSLDMKKQIKWFINDAETRQKKLGLSSEEMRKENYYTKESLIKHFYGKEAYKSLAHQGYVYVMLGEK